MREAFHIDEDDLIQYALGTLSQGQLSQFTAHISVCNECRDHLGRTQVELASFSAGIPLEPIPAGARERFLSRVAADSTAKSKASHSRQKSGLYVASRSVKAWFDSPMPLLILSGALAAGLLFAVYDDLSNIHKIRQMGPALSRFERQATELAELKNFLNGTSTMQVSLHERPPLAKSPEGHATYSAVTGKLIFTASNMPAPPHGKAYELWLLPSSGGAPVPAGVFTPDSLGSAAVIFPSLPTNVQAGGFGVTVEDAAGSAVPTSPIVLSGQ